MKVGTDGVLLGAWSTIKEGNILDIGTGTGLIAIMLAQRCSNSKIDAVEMKYEAYVEAVSNVNDCHWSERIATHNCSIQHFNPNRKYDSIVSNTPFFIDSTKATDLDRNTARHTDSLSFDDLIDSIIKLLKPEGNLSLILPIVESDRFIALAEKQGLYLNKKCNVCPNPNKKSKRVLLEFSFKQNEILNEELIIETETRHQYTPEYISLTKDFYLKF